MAAEASRLEAEQLLRRVLLVDLADAGAQRRAADDPMPLSRYLQVGRIQLQAAGAKGSLGGPFDE